MDLVNVTLRNWFSKKDKCIFWGGSRLGLRHLKSPPYIIIVLTSFKCFPVEKFPRTDAIGSESVKSPVAESKTV